MAAYILFIREEPIHNPAEMAEYQRIGRENTGDFKMKPLAVYGAMELLEGSKLPDGVAMLEFPTVEDARTWYNSPGYQAAAPHRLKAAGYTSFILEGFSPG